MNTEQSFVARFLNDICDADTGVLHTIAHHSADLHHSETLTVLLDRLQGVTWRSVQAVTSKDYDSTTVEVTVRDKTHILITQANRVFAPFLRLEPLQIPACSH